MIAKLSLFLNNGMKIGSFCRFWYWIKYYKGSNHPDRVKNMEGPWHEFVGMEGSDAKHRLSLDCPELNEITVLDQHSLMTMDFKLDRVRIFVDDQGIVVRAPSKG